MGKAVRFGLAAAALMIASPALASDFSGIGRAIYWGIAAIVVLVAIPVALIMRRDDGGSRGGSAFLAVVTSIMFAPALVYPTYDRSEFTPAPGSLVAMVDGSWATLWPIPLVSIAACSYGLFRLFERGASARHGRGGGAP